MASQGVHEHWNNATEKKYTRNLGTGNGIELLYMPKNVSIAEDGAAHRRGRDGGQRLDWRLSRRPSNNVVLGAVSNASDLSASYRALYDDTNLYVLVDVTDDVVIARQHDLVSR